MERNSQRNWCVHNYAQLSNNVPTNADQRQFLAHDVARNDSSIGFDARPCLLGTRNRVVVPRRTCPCSANGVDSGMINRQQIPFSNNRFHTAAAADFSCGGGGGSGGVGGSSDFYNRQQIPSSNNGFHTATAADFSCGGGGGGSSDFYNRQQIPSSNNGFHTATAADFSCGGGGGGSSDFYNRQQIPSSNNGSYLPIVAPPNSMVHSSNNTLYPVVAPHSIGNAYSAQPQPQMSRYGLVVSGGGGGGGISDFNNRQQIPSSNNGSYLATAAAPNSMVHSSNNTLYPVVAPHSMANAYSVQPQPQISGHGLVVKGGGSGVGGISNFYNRQQIPSSNNGSYLAAATPPNSMVNSSNNTLYRANAYSVQPQPQISGHGLVVSGGGGGGGGISDFYNCQQIPSSNNGSYLAAATPPNSMVNSSNNTIYRANAYSVQPRPQISGHGLVVRGGDGGRSSGTYSYPSYLTPYTTTSSHVPAVASYWPNGHPMQPPISDFAGSAGGGSYNINSQYVIPSSNTSTLYPPTASGFRTSSDIGHQYQQQGQHFSSFGFPGGDSHGGDYTSYPNHQIRSVNYPLHSGGDSHGGDYTFCPNHQFPSVNKALHLTQVPPPSFCRHTAVHNTCPHDSINPTGNNTQEMIRAIRPEAFMDHDGIYQQVTDEFIATQPYQEDDEWAMIDEFNSLSEESMSLLSEDFSGDEEDYESMSLLSEEYSVDEEDYVSTSTGLSEETISKLKTKAFDFSAIMDEVPKICVVCQAQYEDQEMMASLPCGHRYHADCIKKWLLRKTNCPICKATVYTIS